MARRVKETFFYLELEKLTFVPGGRYLMANYLQIEEGKKLIEV